ncbi:hypothetical protein BA895_11455 [Humibacillus sp. DSM 29435]|uniref:ice-binding family protein n=1 Tax=Humibacillus sp. DSM 29435 TaxID=1869167 RepID=UPI000872BD9C|nr:ice-binding family protein [Humibacillus sp. DSM 29435]OFE14224.1 hypothetical protein BA895_11455 [Humibacillus sp. DSM 29435]
MTTRIIGLPRGLAVAFVGLAATFTLISATIGASPARAAEAPVGLGTATSFAVLAGRTVTNTGPSTISGDLGVSPGSAIPGFPPGSVSNGTIHKADAVAGQAKSDLTTAYNDAAGRSTTATVTGDLGGKRLTPGVYTGGALGLTGTLTLDAGGDSNAVFIFQASSTLITGSASRVLLLGGANACNVFWKVAKSATLGTGSTFNGTILALTSVSAKTGASVRGRLLARNGAVTLDNNTITRPTGCRTTTGTAPTATGLTPTSGSTTGGTKVTVNGTGFVPGKTTVKIGDTTIPSGQVTVTSPTKLTFTTPAHRAGPVTVRITTPAGTSGPQQFTYGGAGTSPTPPIKPPGVGAPDTGGGGSGSPVNTVAGLGLLTLAGLVAGVGVFRRRRETA